MTRTIDQTLPALGDRANPLRVLSCSACEHNDRQQPGRLDHYITVSLRAYGSPDRNMPSPF
jgi:hypothetical protein